MGLAPAAKEKDEEEDRPTPDWAAETGEVLPKDDARGEPTPKNPPNELPAALGVGVGMGAVGVVEWDVRGGKGPDPAAMAREA